MSLDKAVWGPAFWSLLHTWAERLGYQESDMLDRQEAEEWARFIRYLSEILPCRVCQTHAHLVRRPNFERLRGEALRVAARDWLYNFHESVRQRTMKGARPYPVTELPKYKNKALGQDVQVVLKSIQLGILNNIVRQEAASVWKAHFYRLQLMLGL